MSDAAEPGWQPVVGFDGYPRPRGASPIRVSLVPAFAECIDPNTQHGAPLAYDSCGPPVQKSSGVTVGQRSIGSFFAKPLLGDPDTPADESDIAYRFDLTDVRRQSPPGPYEGELRLESSLRSSDGSNGPSGTEDATAVDASLAITIPCAPSTAPGSRCELITTANTLLPGTTREGARAVWELGQVRVYDGGADVDVGTAADNELLAVQGVFVP